MQQNNRGNSLFTQFHAERGGADTLHGDVLYWHGTQNGFPVRGQPTDPLLKQDEIDELPLETLFQSRMFKLWEPQDKIDFDYVRQRCTAGWFRELKRADTYIPEHNHFQVWLEWIQVYGKAK